MNTYAVIGGSLWGNRGAEAMVASTIAKVRDRDPEASFLLMSYFPARDQELVDDPRIRVVDATPAQTTVHLFFAALSWMTGQVSVRLPDALLPSSVRLLRQCRALFDVSGVSFHDGRLAIVAYNLMCVWPALLLRVPVIRLSQAMGPFRHPLNRFPARWVTKRSLHSFARGRLTAQFLEGLRVPSHSWSIAADVAFAYQPEYSLTSENEDQVGVLRAHLTEVRESGTSVVALVPSSLVSQKMTSEGTDYVALLKSLIRNLQQRGVHVLVMPNATRAGVDALRNNDIVVIEEMGRRMSNAPDGIDESLISYVAFDLNTASIRDLMASCSLVITSRFHAMVAALALGVPTLVMGWSHKYEEVLEMFGCADHAIDFSEAEEKLVPAVEKLLTHSQSVRKRIVTALPTVVSSAESQFEVLDRLG